MKKLFVLFAAATLFVGVQACKQTAEETTEAATEVTEAVTEDATAVADSATAAAGAAGISGPTKPGTQAAYNAGAVLGKVKRAFSK